MANEVLYVRHTKNVEVDRIDAGRVAYNVISLAAQVAAVIEGSCHIGDSRRKHLHVARV